MIPRGTGWDFARSLGIPRKIDDAIEVALTGRRATIDLGRATLPAVGGRRSESRWFANVASAGMSGAIAQRANDTSKALGGKVSYALGDVRRASHAGQNSEVDGLGGRRDAPRSDARRHRRPTAHTSAAG